MKKCELLEETELSQEIKTLLFIRRSGGTILTLFVVMFCAFWARDPGASFVFVRDDENKELPFGALWEIREK